MKYDGEIVSRLKDYFEDDEKRKQLAVKDIANDLRRVHLDYRRRRWKPFLQSVRDAARYLNEDDDSVVVNNRLSGMLNRLYSGNGEDTDKHEQNDTEMEDKPDCSVVDAISGSSSSCPDIPQADEEQANSRKAEPDKLEVSVLDSVVDQRSPIRSERRDKRAAKRRPSDSLSNLQNTLVKRVKFTLKSRDVNFGHVGGLDTSLANLREWIADPVAQDGLNFLIHGPRGCGKTLLARSIAGELNLATLEVNGYSPWEVLSDAFKKASACAPCVLFIDNIDGITAETQMRMDPHRASELIQYIEDLRSTEKDSADRVVIIGTTARYRDLDLQLFSVNEIEVSIPSQRARAEILEVLCRDICAQGSLDFERVAELTPGFVGLDLKKLVTKAQAEAHRRTKQTAFQAENKDGMELDTQSLLTSQLNLSTSDFLLALKSVKASSQRADAISVPNVTWDDVGSLQDIREELTLTILAPIKFPDEVAQMGLSAPSGVLLCGPPGCGKTLLAKAIANESGVNFISVKGPELMNMYVGESERAVRACFQRAQNSSPCVIFFDEFDALCPTRSTGNQNGSGTRIVNQLLTEMDGIEERKGVFILAATNRPDIIDPAILRPGRLDKILYVGLPHETDRVEIIKAITKNGTKPLFDDSVDINNLAKQTDGCTGADLAGLVKHAAELCLKRYIRNRSLSVAGTTLRVSSEHIGEALRKLRPSVSEKERKVYENLRLKYAPQRQLES